MPGPTRGLFLAVFSPLAGRSDVFLDEDTVLIGRAEHCSVRLESLQVEREHARIVRTPPGWRVEDLGSRAGIRVNGTRVTQRDLAPQDEIEIGSFLIRVEEGARRYGQLTERLRRDQAAGAERLRPPVASPAPSPAAPGGDPDVLIGGPQPEAAPGPASVTARPAGIQAAPPAPVAVPPAARQRPASPPPVSPAVQLRPGSASPGSPAAPMRPPSPPPARSAEAPPGAAPPAQGKPAAGGEEMPFVSRLLGDWMDSARAARADRASSRTPATPAAASVRQPTPVLPAVPDQVRNVLIGDNDSRLIMPLSVPAVPEPPPRPEPPPPPPAAWIPVIGASGPLIAPSSEPPARPAAWVAPGWDGQAPRGPSLLAALDAGAPPAPAPWTPPVTGDAPLPAGSGDRPGAALRAEGPVGRVEPDVPALGAGARSSSRLFQSAPVPSDPVQDGGRGVVDLFGGPGRGAAPLAEPTWGREGRSAHDLLEFLPVDEHALKLGGMDTIKRWVTLRQHAFEEKAQAFGVPRPRSILVLGLPGSGRRHVARAFAHIWKFRLARVKFEVMVSEDPATWRPALNATLQKVERSAPLVLLIDDVDRLALGAGNEDGVTQQMAQRVVATLMAWLRQKTGPVFACLTATDVGWLPPELTRRGPILDEIFYVDLPTPRERHQIWQLKIAEKGRRVASYDIAALVAGSEGYTGGELERAVEAGLCEAFVEGRELTTGDVLRCLEATPPIARSMAGELSALRERAPTFAVNAGGVEARAEGVQNVRALRGRGGGAAEPGA